MGAWDTNSEKDRLWRGSCAVDFLLDSIIVSFFMHSYTPFNSDDDSGDDDSDRPEYLDRRGRPKMEVEASRNSEEGAVDR